MNAVNWSALGLLLSLKYIDVDVYLFPSHFSVFIGNKAWNPRQERWPLRDGRAIDCEFHSIIAKSVKAATKDRFLTVKHLLFASNSSTLCARSTQMSCIAATIFEIFFVRKYVAIIVIVEYSVSLCSWKFGTRTPVCLCCLVRFSLHWRRYRFHFLLAHFLAGCGFMGVQGNPGCGTWNALC